jgi:3-hydroxyisobutyrate dehydrogenase-like beta-hydroxyacid dehydrogenase
LDLFAGTAGRVAEMKRKPIAEHDFSPHFALAALVKDLRAARDAAAASGLQLPLLAQTCALYERALAAGKGSLDFSAITEFNW